MIREYSLEQKARRAELERNRWRERREFGLQFLGGKCVDCGTDKKLEFDHKNPNDKTLELFKGTPSLEMFKAELLKCELRCKGCHKKKSDTEQTQPIVHATFQAYNKRKCRCEICVAWYSDYRKQRRNVVA